MKIALFSDIHGNIVGLEAVLARLDQLGGADVVFALGDFLAVGPGTDDVIELLVSRQARMVRGNWDEIFVDPDAYLARTKPQLQAVVERHFEWLQRNTSAATRALLASLPLHADLAVAPGHKLFVCHAAPNDTRSSGCSAATSTAQLRQLYGSLDAEVVAYGHYHAHHVIPLDKKLLINVASIGMQRNGFGQSAFTILEYADDRWNVQQHQVPYDVAAFERLSRERGVPTS
jgi:putative phosphoesterase